MLKWVGEKRAREASQTAPETLAKLTRQWEDERPREIDRAYEPGSPEGQAVRAIRLEKFGDRPKAKAVWESLAAQTEKEPDQHVWYLIAAQQAAQITIGSALLPVLTTLMLFTGPRRPSRRMWPLLVGAGVCDTGATLLDCGCGHTPILPHLTNLLTHDTQSVILGR